MSKRWLVAGALLLAWALPAARADTPLGQDVHGALLAEVRQTLRDQYGDIGFVRRYVRANMPMFGDRQAEKMALHLKTLLTNERTIDRIIEYARPAIQARMSRQQLQSYFAEIGMGLAAKGVGRLDDADIVYYLGTVVDMHRALPAEMCKATANRELTARQMSYMEYQWMSTMDEAAFDAHLAFYRRAYLAEVENRPGRRSANSKQIELATQALGHAIRRRIDRLPDPVPVYAALDDMQQAEAQHACTAVLEVLQSYADLDEPLRGWALTAFTDEMAR